LSLIVLTTVAAGAGAAGERERCIFDFPLSRQTCGFPPLRQTHDFLLFGGDLAHVEAK
jgi:hypothetical protein